VIDFELQFLSQEVFNGVYHPFAGSFRTDVNVTVIGIAAELMTPSFQFLV
jgi:hypothetical protein